MEINNKEVLPINTTKERFFYEYLLLKKVLLEAILSRVNKKPIILNPKLLQVLALLLYYNDKYNGMPENVKWDMIFNGTTRKEIAESLNINTKHLNTYLSILRGMRVLNGKSINKPFIIYPHDGFELVYKFGLDEQ